MSDLARRPKLRTFLQSHTKSSHYSFSVVKCTSERCDVCFTRRLPADVILAHLPDPVPQADGEHYKQFQVCIGLLTALIQAGVHGNVPRELVPM